jgi:tetratricopeptide (TPR) repeat protein
MALVDPYAACPCGSEKKYKWCCQKAEPFAERANRLLENGQYDAAVAALNEGLARYPNNPWLLLRRAVVQITLQKPEEARQSLAAILREAPDHVAAAALQTRLVLMADGPVAAASEFQHALSHVKPESRPRLIRMAALLANSLAETGLVPAGLKHYELAASFGNTEASFVSSAFRALKSNPVVSRWLKQPFALAPAPEALRDPIRQQFEQALRWGREGLWQRAAAAFDLLSSDPVAGPAAERNLGLCRLWLGDEAAALSALRRWIDRAEPSTEAVDLAALCEEIDDTADPEPIEHVQLSWPLRNREALLRVLGDQSTMVEAPRRHLDFADDETPEVDCRYWLDRPLVEARSGLTVDQIPLIQANVLIGLDAVVLETDDDGRLNALIDRFTALVGQSVPPAHPRTKVVVKVSRSEHALSWHWYLPPELAQEEKTRLTREKMARLVSEVWPQTPVAYFGRRTPLQVARSRGAEILLRAAVMELEHSGDDLGELVDWPALRSRLGIPPEPVIDPDTVEIDRISLGRLAKIPVRRLNNDRLIRAYARAHEWGLIDLLLEAAHEIVARPGLELPPEIRTLDLFRDLAHEAAGRNDRAAALEWVARGRGRETKRDVASAVDWDMLELQVKTTLDKPEDWVPDLVSILERYRGKEEATPQLTTRLLEMGLLQIASAPERPNELLIDSRPLQQLVSLYGPRVTTAAGYVGVSATKGEIWTPESTSRGPALWTPGADLGETAAGQRSKIILP